MKSERNIYKANLYKEKYGFKCMNPECKKGLNPNTHHIIPLSKKGLDSEENYILLCSFCHRHYKRHSDFKNQEIKLATWKYYFESLFECQKIQENVQNCNLPFIEDTIPLETEIEKIQEIPHPKAIKAHNVQKGLKKVVSLDRLWKNVIKREKLASKLKKQKMKKIRKRFTNRISCLNGGRWIRYGFLMDAITRI